MMKFWVACLAVMLCWGAFLEATMTHRKTVGQRCIERNVSPFNELMISWNAERPEQGKFVFYTSVKVEGTWSPWMLYASWGSEGQEGCQSAEENAVARVFQDAVEVLHGKKATGFQVKVVREGAVGPLRALHIYTNGGETPVAARELSAVALEVKGLSQMQVDHERRLDLCSPTSTAAVVGFLANKEIDPVHFAKRAWDGKLDIFGNWVFNVAEASSALGSGWECWVERLSGFEAIHQRLAEGAPVVVSVRGPLSGSALPYAKGHLMAVVGYRAVERKVLCMDPAFPSNEETLVSYDLEDFMQAWGRRGNIAYVFGKAAGGLDNRKIMSRSE